MSLNRKICPNRSSRRRNPNQLADCPISRHPVFISRAQKDITRKLPILIWPRVGALDKQIAVELALAAKQYFIFSGAIYCFLFYKLWSAPKASWKWLLQDDWREIKEQFWRAPAYLAVFFFALFLVWWAQAFFWAIFGSIFGAFVTVPLVIIAPFFAIWYGHRWAKSK